MEWDTANFKDESRAKLQDLVPLADYKKHSGEFGAYRFIGKLKPIAQIWIPIYKDGAVLVSEKTKKPVEIPFFVTNYDYVNGKFIEGKKCPFVELANFMNNYREKPIRPSESKLAQAITRFAQEDGSDDNGRFRRRGKPTPQEKSTGFKEAKDSECRTPVEIHTIGYMIGQDIKSVMDLNKVKVKVRNPTTQAIEVKVTKKPIADPKFGCDVQIKFDPTIKGSKKTSAQRGEVTPLTEDESTYLLWDLDKVIAQLVMSPAEAKAEATRIAGEFKKSLKGGGAARKAQSDEIDESDLPGDIDEDVSDLGLDEAPAPQTRRVQGKPPAKTVSSDDELDFSDLEEKPAPKSAKPGAKPTGRTPPAKVKDEADLLFGDDEGVDLDDGLGIDDDDIPF